MRLDIEPVASIKTIVFMRLFIYSTPLFNVNNIPLISSLFPYKMLYRSDIAC
jgi:hypothetical protein